MREIKFRAWDIDRMEMFIPYEISIGKKGIRCRGGWNSSMVHRVGEFNLMQYTGLKDKKGKEIYEGDVVEIDDGDGWVVGTIEVKFENGAFNCSCYDRDTGEFIEDTQTLKIIGNIYENPKLIK